MWLGKEWIHPLLPINIDSCYSPDSILPLKNKCEPWNSPQDIIIILPPHGYLPWFAGSNYSDIPSNILNYFTRPPNTSTSTITHYKVVCNFPSYIALLLPCSPTIFLSSGCFPPSQPHSYHHSKLILWIPFEAIASVSCIHIPPLLHYYQPLPLFLYLP